MTINAQHISNALGGKQSGGGYLAPCPVCSRAKLSINDGRNGKPVFYCFVCGSEGQFGILSALQGQGLWPTSDKKLTDQEFREMREEAEALRLLHEKEKAASQAKAATWAQTILGAATDDPTTHPYAIKKGLPLGDRIKRGFWKPKGWEDALLIPLYDKDRKTTSISAINTDGTKDLLAGGKTKGSFYPLGKITGASKVFIGEGLATMAACHESTGVPCVMAVSAGNLKAVAEVVRQMAAPGAEIILISDDDRHEDGRNPGKSASTAAATAIGGKIAILDIGRTADAWDLWKEQGPDAVKKMINAAVAPVPTSDDVQKVRSALAAIRPQGMADDCSHYIGVFLRDYADQKTRISLAKKWDRDNKHILNDLGITDAESILRNTNYKAPETMTESVNVEYIFNMAKERGWDGGEVTKPKIVATDLYDLLGMDIPPRKNLLMPIIQEQSLNMVHAWRGVGKTHVALGVGYAVASGGNFLKWKAETPRKVLYVDGEMPISALQERADQRQL